MTTPTVVEKQPVDIDFTRGLDESVRPESLDWMHSLKRTENADFDEPGVMKSRKGNATLASTDSDGNAYGPIYRLLPTSEGMAFAGKGFNLYHINESIPDVRRKGQLPEFSVEPTVMGSWGAAGYGTAANLNQARVLCTFLTSNYRIMVYEAPAAFESILAVQDRYSGNIINVQQVHTGHMCIVDDRYLHIGSSGSANVYQYDLNTIGSGATTIPVGTGTKVTAICANSNGGGSVLTTDNNRVVKVSTGGSTSNFDLSIGYAMTRLTDVYSYSGLHYVVGCTATNHRAVVLNNSLTVTTSFDHAIINTDVAKDIVRVVVGTLNGVVTPYALVYHSEADITHPVPTLYIYYLVDPGGGGVFGGIAQLPNWCEVGKPFYHPTTEGFYVPVLKLAQAGHTLNGVFHVDTGDIAASSVVFEWAHAVTNGDVTGGMNFRVAAVLDAYTDHTKAVDLTTGAQVAEVNGVVTAGDSPCTQRPYVSGPNVTIGGTFKSTFGSAGFEFRHLRLYDAQRTHCDSDTISGGCVTSYDGWCANEHGWVDVPSIYTIAAGGGAAASYEYTCIYEFKDNIGRSFFSRTANPALVTNPNGNVTLQITIPTVTMHRRLTDNTPSAPSSVICHIYRTTNGGTQFNLATSIDVLFSSTDGIVGWTDLMTDYSSNPLLYRQPGTLGTAVDRCNALAGQCVLRHKDRVFYARGSNVYYSSFFVDGEAPWFSPAFQFFVPTGVGPITALASMDGLLVIFKRNNIFVVDGDGPPENGGSGTEFSPPRQLSVEIGCTDPRSIMFTPKGVMFRSSRGFELLDRSLQIAPFHGGNVFRTVDANPYTGGGAFDRTRSRCVWVLGSTAGTYNGQLDTSQDGTAVVYEVVTDTWTTYKLRTNAGYGKAMQDICFAPVQIGAADTVDDKLLFGDGTSILYETTNGYDTVGVTNYFVPVVLETGYAKSQSKQDRVRVSDLQIAGIKNSAAAVSVGYASDYSSSYSSIKTWSGATVGGLSLVQLEAQPPKELCQSISFQISTADPTPTALGNGKQIDIFGLTVRIGLKGGGAKIAAAQKG